MHLLILYVAVGQHDAATQHEGEDQLMVVEKCYRHNPGRSQIKANLSRMSSITYFYGINTSETAFKHLLRTNLVVSISAHTPTEDQTISHYLVSHLLIAKCDKLY